MYPRCNQPARKYSTAKTHKFNNIDKFDKNIRIYQKRYYRNINNNEEHAAYDTDSLFTNINKRQ